MVMSKMVEGDTGVPIPVRKRSSVSVVPLDGTTDESKYIKLEKKRPSLSSRRSSQHHPALHDLTNPRPLEVYIKTNSQDETKAKTKLKKFTIPKPEPYTIPAMKPIIQHTSQRHRTSKHRRRSSQRISTSKKTGVVSRRGSRKHKLNLSRITQDLIGYALVATLACVLAFVLSMVFSKRLLSTVLGYSVVFVMSIAKLPHIAKLEDAQTAEGVSFFKHYNDVLACTLTCMFHINRSNAFINWGESVFKLIQDMYIVHLLWTFSKMHVEKRMALTCVYAAFAAMLAYGVGTIDGHYKWVIPLVKLLLSKPGLVTQAYSNFENEHTGAQSETTLSIITTTKFIRLFTVVASEPDPILILNAILAFVLNSIIFLQIIVFKENTEKFLKNAERNRDKIK